MGAGGRGCRGEGEDVADDSDDGNDDDGEDEEEERRGRGRRKRWWSRRGIWDWHGTVYATRYSPAHLRTPEARLVNILEKETHRLPIYYVNKMLCPFFIAFVAGQDSPICPPSLPPRSSPTVLTTSRPTTGSLKVVICVLSFPSSLTSLVSDLSYLRIACTQNALPNCVSTATTLRYISNKSGVETATAKKKGFFCHLWVWG